MACSRARPRCDQVRLAALGEAGSRSGRSRAGAPCGSKTSRASSSTSPHVVAGGDVDQGEQLRPPPRGRPRPPGRGRVAGVGGALRLLLGEARVVDQQLGAARRPRASLAGRGVAGDRRACGPRATRPSPRRADRPGGALDRLAALQARRSAGPSSTPEPLRRAPGRSAPAAPPRPARSRRRARCARPRRRGSRRRRGATASPASSSTRSSSYPSRPITRPRLADQLAQAARPVDRQRPLALGQVVGLQQARQAEDSGRRGSG